MLCSMNSLALVGAGQLRGGRTSGDAKNVELLGAIRQAKDMLGQGPMLAGVQAKSINSGELRAPPFCHPWCEYVGPTCEIIIMRCCSRFLSYWAM